LLDDTWMVLADHRRMYGLGWRTLSGQGGAGHHHHRLVERLAMDKTLRRICGFSPFAKLPSEATFRGRLPVEGRLAERAYRSHDQGTSGDQLIGTSADGTAIAARENCQRQPTRHRQQVGGAR
jgi:hypothetical protein